MKEETMERVKRALKATRSIGLPDEEVIPILKNLYKLLDKNWETIEADNYRALFDAYFMAKDDQAKGVEVQAPFTKGTKSQIIALNGDGQEGGRPKSQICPGSTRDSYPPSAKRSNYKKIDQNVNGTANFGFVCHPGSSSDGSFTIASSTSKEVKILLNCASAVGKSNFQKPDVYSVLKSLEDKYLRINKLVTPHFSVMKLLKDLCESYIELGTVAENETPLTIRKVPSSSPNPRPKKRLSVGASNSESSNLQMQEKKDVLKVSDISKGAENVKISLVNEMGKGDYPKFTYITRNVIYQDAYLQISLARISDEDCCSSCLGDCVASRIPCACARETGGEYAYTKHGLLKEEFINDCMSVRQNPKEHHFVYCQDCPLERSKNEYVPDKCKGHLLRKFIKECWIKCGCDMNCGNRVVQRGIRCNLQVFMTGEGKGWGVRTLEKLAKGTFVCEYVGEILTNMELYERNLQSSGRGRHTYPVTLDADWGSERLLKDEEALCLDATFCGNVARFINHRCNDGNLIDIPVEVETPDRHYYHLAFFTRREVGAMEELTWDYGIDFADHDHPIKAFACCCGSTFCRDIHGKRYLNL